jgi:myosin heavy subunit
MEALTNAEQRIKEIKTAADQKVAQLEKDVASKKFTNISSESSPEITEKLKKAECESAQRLSDYNKELEKNRQLSSEINKLNELHNNRVAEAQKNVEKLKSEITESQLRTKACLQRLCPSVSIDSSLPFEKWLSQFEQQASVSQSTESSVNIEELLEQKEKEFSLKQRHYDQVLAETESTLSNLQRAAESQEVHWQERLKCKEQELEQIKSERDALVTEKEAMQSTFQQISQLEELQEKLKLLQSTLENAENERTHLEQKYEEVHKNCLNLRDQLENKEKQILELQKESNSLDSLNKEIEDLKTKLEKEKKISKDFSSQMVRLNSLVKIGQDALKAEQEMVKKLKGQLEGTQVSTANGTASATKANPVTVNEDALDKK